MHEAPTIAPGACAVRRCGQIPAGLLVFCCQSPIAPSEGQGEFETSNVSGNIAHAQAETLSLKEDLNSIFDNSN